jgi:hypothetical protein
MRGILKRLERLEEAEDKEAFSNALDFAVAYYLGGAKDPLQVMDAHARALGYKNVEKFFDAFAKFSVDKSGHVTGIADIRARIRRAHCKLFAKFGYDFFRATPEGLADAAYRIVKTLPEEWRATIKSVHWEAEAAADQLRKGLMHEDMSPTRRRLAKPK